jgi:hypothetical protein
MNGTFLIALGAVWQFVNPCPCGSGKKMQTVKLAASNLMLGKSTRGISQGKNG